jgi:6-phosphogluconolactonase
MELHIAKDANQLSIELAQWIAEYIDAVLENQDRFTLVLSGGSTPKLLYRILAASPYKESIPWEKIHFFWGDERAVSYEDERNNAKMCYEELLNHVPVLADHIHVMRTDVAVESSVAEYNQILDTYFPEGERSFDLVLLGMGDDGHTLSLFPGTKVIHEASQDTFAFYLPAQEMHRITLTAPIVNRAAQVVFLAAGAGKAETLKHVLEGTIDLDTYPSQIIKPVDGGLHWFVDEAAAAALDKA